MRGLTLGEVVASKSQAYKVGTIVEAAVGWRELARAKETEVKEVEIPDNGKITDALGVLGTRTSRSGDSKSI